MPSRVVIVPGLAVRSYAVPAASALRRTCRQVDLLRAPAWRRTPADLARYGTILARRLDERAIDVDLLVGLSVGSQAAAVAAARTRRIRRLLLVSPTVDPRRRTVLKLAAAWLGGDPEDVGSPLPVQLRDWAHAGVPRIAAGFLSSLRVPLEEVLPRVPAELTLVHTEHDSIGTRAWVAQLAQRSGGRLLDRPGAVHSWPIGDPAGFVALVEELDA